jgi:hypothetical protein
MIVGALGRVNKKRKQNLKHRGVLANSKEFIYFLTLEDVFVK